jgi:SAM-dependent methyltransferase
MQYETVRAPRATATAGRLTYRQGDVGSWEPDQGSFDAVVTTRTLHHVPDPAAALGRMRRRLRPGGRLVALLSRERLGRSLRVPQPWLVFNVACSSRHEEATMTSSVEASMADDDLFRQRR